MSYLSMIFDIVYIKSIYLKVCFFIIFQFVSVIVTIDVILCDVILHENNELVLSFWILDIGLLEAANVNKYE